jgi:transcription antitermination factor NusG
MEETTSVEKVEKAEKESKWYVLRVVSGKERKVKEYLDKDIVRNGWDKVIRQIFLPVEKVYKVLNGKKVIDQVDSKKKHDPEEILLDTGMNFICFFADDYGKNHRQWCRSANSQKTAPLNKLLGVLTIRNQPKLPKFMPPLTVLQG